MLCGMKPADDVPCVALLVFIRSSSNGRSITWSRCQVCALFRWAHYTGKGDHQASAPADSSEGKLSTHRVVSGLCVRYGSCHWHLSRVEQRHFAAGISRLCFDARAVSLSTVYPV